MVKSRSNSKIAITPLMFKLACCSNAQGVGNQMGNLVVNTLSGTTSAEKAHLDLNRVAILNISK